MAVSPSQAIKPVYFLLEVVTACVIPFDRFQFFYGHMWYNMTLTYSGREVEVSCVCMFTRYAARQAKPSCMNTDDVCLICLCREIEFEFTLAIEHL